MVLVQKMMAIVLTATLLGCENALAAGQYLDANGHLKGMIQENGDNGYMILDENGRAQAYIQENGDNGYMILDSEGHAQGFYQEN